jgi:DNA recombination protein RmuC
MDVLIFVGGIVVGGIIAWLFAKAKLQARQGLSMSEVESKYVSKELYSDAKRELYEQQQKILQLSNRVAAQDQLIAGYQEKLQNQKEELNTLQDKFRIEFKNLANELLEEKSRKFTALNEEKIGLLLNPLKEKITDFRARLEETYTQEIRERTSLKTEIEQLLRLNQQVSEDAIRLTNALKGDSKVQGDWGEVQLEMILTKAGLVKGIHYTSQSSFTDEQGRQKRPDYIIHLPEDKNLILDAKVSLTAYNSYFNAEDTSVQPHYLREHVESVRQHIKTLSEKSYQQLYQINQPDYVIMFVPIEPALSVVMQEEKNIFERCLEKNIVLVSTSTLLATLRTISYIWKQENQKKNVVKIAQESGKLYDKFVNFVEDLQSIGRQLEAAQKSYDGAMNKLVDGRGSLVKKVEKIRKLGANTSKAISPHLLDRAYNEE